MLSRYRSTVTNPHEVTGDSLELSLDNEARSVPLARRAVAETLLELGMGDLARTAELVVTELVGNAVLHTHGPVRLELVLTEGGVRLSVFDSSPVMPVMPPESSYSMTGRGLLLVRGVSAQFGFGPVPGGKVVWSEMRAGDPPGAAGVGPPTEAGPYTRNETSVSRPGTQRVELGDVPTDLLLAAKAHVDSLVREFLLAAAGAADGSTAAVPPHLAELIEAVVNRFSNARLSIKRQALDAARLGRSHVRLRLDLGPEAAEAGQAYLAALDEADAYCRAARLLTLETPPKHRVFRRWYVGEIITQLQRVGTGLTPVPTQSFEQCLLQEIDAVAAARARAERAARLYTVASALAGAITPEAVADAVLSEGVAALGASGGGMMLGTDTDRLAVPGTVGYDDRLVASLRSESPAAELPAAVALRTGSPVWLESVEERDTRFPELVDLEQRTVAMCAVPLQVGDRRLGALRFSFSEQRLFDEDERRFVLALAAQAAQALDRAQLYEDRSELSRRLQRSLLPPDLPDIPGIDLAAVYHPLGDGIEVGGDFYDVWALGNGRWAFALGDVCGTGPEAAALTALVRNALRALTTPTADVAAVLRRLNEVLIQSGGEFEERFCTVVFGIISPRTDGVMLHMATGGHPEPLLVRADGNCSLVPSGGSLLGVLPRVDLVTKDILLRPGDSIIFYTDGVTEARSGRRMFGEEGLVDSACRGGAGANAIAAGIERAVLDHVGGHLEDDLAVLVFRPGT